MPLIILFNWKRCRPSTMQPLHILAYVPRRVLVRPTYISICLNGENNKKWYFTRQQTALQIMDLAPICIVGWPVSPSNIGA